MTLLLKVNLVLPGYSKHGNERLEIGNELHNATRNSDQAGGWVGGRTPLLVHLGNTLALLANQPLTEICLQIHAAPVGDSILIV